MTKRKKTWPQEVIAPRNQILDAFYRAFYPITQRETETVIHIGEAHVTTLEQMKKRVSKIIEVDNISGGHPTVIWERKPRHGKGRS